MTHDDIPTLLPPDQMPPVRTDADLLHLWRALMGPLGFGQSRLWFVLLDPDGSLTPVISSVEDNPEQPDEEMVANLVWALRTVAAETPGGLVPALMWTRPGSHRLDRTDAAWLRCVHRELRAHDLDRWPLHFANDVELHVVAPDVLV